MHNAYSNAMHDTMTAAAPLPFHLPLATWKKDTPPLPPVPPYTSNRTLSMNCTCWLRGGLLLLLLPLLLPLGLSTLLLLGLLGLWSQVALLVLSGLPLLLRHGWLWDQKGPHLLLRLLLYEGPHGLGLFQGFPCVSMGLWQLLFKVLCGMGRGAPAALHVGNDGLASALPLLLPPALMHSRPWQPASKLLSRCSQGPADKHEADVWARALPLALLPRNTAGSRLAHCMELRAASTDPRTPRAHVQRRLAPQASRKASRRAASLRRK